ncbi:MAG: hypothetical protein JO270_17230 [Acidobacteriaceae bacterium]|nr:hypothetical protein [Acidobacteriaceae bacterium]MBV8572097.1 hypothetical protein [Acidobacteriaceae bacterium]
MRRLKYTVLHHAYLRGLKTHTDLNWHVATDGWLITVPAAMVPQSTW